MSRIRPQVGLSSSPGIPTGVGNVSPGSFTPVADNTAGNLLGLVQQAVGTIGAIQEQDKRKSDEELQSAYEASSANLIRLQQEAQRDPNKESAFLYAYDAAAKKFAGTRFESEVASMGESTRTAFAQKAERKFEAAADAFVDLKVMPAVMEALADEDTRKQILRIPDYSDRQAAIEDVVIDNMPERAADVLTDAARENIARTVIGINNQFQQKFESNLEQQRIKTNTDIAKSAVNGFSRRDISWQQFEDKMKVADVDMDRASQFLADAILNDIQTASNLGDTDGILHGTASAWEALQHVTGPSVRNKLSAAVAAGNEAYGAAVSDNFGRKWSSTVVEFGVEAANQAVDSMARSALSEAYGQEAFTIADISQLPESGPNGAFKNAVVSASKKLMQTPDAPSLTKFQTQAVRNMLNPVSASDGDFNSLMDATLDDWVTASAASMANTTLASDLFPEGASRDIGGMTVTGPEQYNSLLADASTNLPLRAAIIADRIAGTRHERGFLNSFLSNQNYFSSEDGFLIVRAAVEELGGDRIDELLSQQVGSPAQRYALKETLLSQDPTLENYNRNLAQYQQARFKVGNNEDATVHEAVKSHDFARAFMGAGVWSKHKNYALDEKAANRLLNLVPLESIPGSATNPKVLAEKIKEHLDQVGLYAIWEPADTPGGRDFFAITPSQAIPEAIGWRSTDVSEALSDPSNEVPLQRYLANTMSGGETNNIWEHAAQQLRLQLGRDSGASIQEETKRLQQLAEDGKVKIVVKPSLASNTSVPVMLQVEGQNLEIGIVNFNNGFFQSRGPRYLNPQGQKNKGAVMVFTISIPGRSDISASTK
jgi:hypothetical protein